MPVGNDGKAEKLTAEHISELLPQLSQLSFGQLLDWLLKWGARPDGYRKPWHLKEFAGAVIPRADDPTRTVRNWLRDTNFPNDADQIERALFGDCTLYGPWRPLLRNAWLKARTQKRPNSPRRPLKHRTRLPFIGVPPYINTFIGREQELSRLQFVLLQEKRTNGTRATRRAALIGMAGIGKTTLAVEFAHKFRKSFAGICWCPAETQVGFLTALAGLATSQQIGSPEESNIARAAKDALDWLARPRNKNWLLIYDNVSAPADILDYLPAAGASVLVTSRFFNWQSWADPITLDVFSINNATDYLAQYCPGDEPNARLLADSLGYLPLALDHAAVFCRSTQQSFDDFAAQAAKLIAIAPPGAPYPKTISATFELAINEATARCPHAEILMAFLALCAPERIPLYLLEGAVDDDVDRLQALASLTDLSLLKTDPFPDGTKAVTVHRLVQTVAKARAHTTGTQTLAIQRLLTRISECYPRHPHPYFWAVVVCEQLAPHVLAIQTTLSDHAAKLSPSWVEVLWRAAAFLYDFVDTPTQQHADLLMRDALAIHDQGTSPLLPDTASTIEAVAGRLDLKGDLLTAQKLYERALAVHQKLLGPTHGHTLSCLREIAFLRYRQRDFDGAQSLFERSLALHTAEFGPDHPFAAEVLTDLGMIISMRGNLYKARQLHERALEIYESHPGVGKPDRTMYNLAEILVEQGDTDAALALYLRILTTYETTMRRTDLRKAAMRACKRARDVYNRLWGPGHEKTAAMLHCLAAAIATQGDFDAAKSLYEHSLTIREEILGFDHPETIATRSALLHLVEPST